MSMFDRIGQTYSQSVQDLSEDFSRYERGDINVGQMALRTAGEAVKGTVGNVLGEVTSAVLPDSVEDAIASGVSAALSTETGQNVIEFLDQNPELARDLSSLASVAEVLPIGKGASMFKQGARKVDELTGKESIKGRFVANFDNYIEDFYGAIFDKAPGNLASGLSRPTTKVEEAIKNNLFTAGSKLNKIIDEVIPRLPEKLQGKVGGIQSKRDAVIKQAETKPESMAAEQAARKMTSTAKTLAKGAKQGIYNMMSPSARALWRDQGISKGGQEIIAKHLVEMDLSKKQVAKMEKLIEKYKELPRAKSGAPRTDAQNALYDEMRKQATKIKSRSLPKAVAEAIYQMHIMEQSGRVGNVSPSLLDIAKSSYREDYTKYTKGVLSGWLDQHKVAGRGSFSKQDGDFFEDVLNQIWGEPGVVVMKEPSRNRTSGNHLYDVTSTKKNGTPANILSKVFKERQDWTTQELSDALKARGLNVLKTDDSGIYFMGSTQGSAIVEGGINISGKVMPNGESFFIMSDVHDFLEKTPIIGRAANKQLPNKLMAISPPIHKNWLVKDTTERSASPPRDKTGDKAVVEALKGIATAKARPEVIRAERQKNIGAGLVAGGLMATAAGEKEGA